jgi:PKD repeat protein
MRLTRAFMVCCALGAQTLLAGCSSSVSDFPVAVGNRTTFPIMVFANGSTVGQVGAGQVGSFNLDFVRPTGEVTATPLGNLTSPTPVVDVTFSARELSSGGLSPGQTVRMVQGYVTSVEFKPVCSTTAATTQGDRWACAPSPPAAEFAFSPQSPQAGSPVSFNGAASQTSSGATIDRFVWDFGDPARPALGIGVTATHTFDTAGIYNVTLTVFDNSGQQATTSHAVTVIAR